ncbi:MAG: hypothetical protein IJ820_04790 [Lachnospiraceae bacterium]|nr:hypothetical protein [Lachnospiraceae bacterium]
MGGVTIREYGLSFVWVCLKNYIGRSWPVLVIFLVGIVISVIMSILGRKRENPLEIVTVDGADRNMNYGDPEYDDETDDGATWTFIWVIVICALTVFNPFIVRALIPKLGMTTVYYRFFWVLPITFGAAYYLVKAVSTVQKTLVRVIVCIAAAAVLALVMPLNPGLTNLRMPTNVYKVDGAVPVLCDAIHEDFRTTKTYQKAVDRAGKQTDRNSQAWLKAQARLRPLCVFPYEIEFAVRQYDPQIRLLFNRNLRLYYEGNRTTGITYDETKKRYQRRALILDAMYGRNPDITVEQFTKAMKKTKTKYLIVEEHLANGGFLVQAGCKQVGVAAGYTIFRYGD